MFVRIKSFAKKVVQKVSSVAVAGLAVVGLASTSHAAAIMDFTGVGTAVTTELTPAIAAAMPIAGIILAAGIAWKLYKRFTK